MKQIRTIFLRGLIAFLPIALSLYLIIQLGFWLDRLSSEAFREVVGQDLPFGLGILIGFAVIFVDKRAKL